jgi:hypothetical protein
MKPVTHLERGMGCVKEELTFHIDALLFAESRAELLHFGGEATLGILSSERVMLCDVGPSWWKGMIGGGGDSTNVLD